MDGKGRLYYGPSKDMITYHGHFQDGKRNGWGKMVYRDGLIYDGEWYNDIKHGFAKEFLTNGDVFHGIYINGIRDLCYKTFLCVGYKLEQGILKGKVSIYH